MGTFPPLVGRRAGSQRHHSDRAPRNTTMSEEKLEEYPAKLTADLVGPLSPKARRLFRSPVLATACTVSPGGQPHSSLVWVTNDGHALYLSIATDRLQVRYMRNNHRVSLLAFDPANPGSYAEVRGVASLTETGAMDLIDELSLAYQGRLWPRSPGEQRVLVRVVPTKVFCRNR